MDLGLKGRRALVMASSRGLGLGIAETLAAEGATVTITGRSAERLAEAAGRIGAHHVALDLAAPDAAQRLVAAAREAMGGVDVLVANTGGPPPGRMAEVDLAALPEHFEAMVLRVMQVAGLVIPDMREASWGRILTVGSSGVLQPIPNLGLSNALRSALVGWSKSLAGDLAGDGITVNMILPGRIHTERVDELDAAAARRTGQSPEEVAEASRGTIPAGRYGRVEEFAGVAAFLCSERASYVTGGLIRVDGGMIRGV